MKMIKVKDGLYVEDKGRETEEEVRRRHLERIERQKFEMRKISMDNFREPAPWALGPEQ